MTLGPGARLRRFIERGVFGPLFLLAAVAVAPGPAYASCVPLDLATVPRGDDTVILAGTVTALQADHVFMRVEAWFVGDNPVEDAEIVGGRDPAVISSTDWMPALGDRYLLVAERQEPNGFITKPCQQLLVEAGVIERAAGVLGPPLSPPFADTSSPPAASPSPIDGSPSGGEADTPWVAFTAIASLGALVVVLTLRRRQQRWGPG